MRVGIVCGYDLNADLEAYVSSIRPLLANEPLDLVIFSGGRTSPSSFSSEAYVIAQGCAEVIAPDRVLLEEHAMTTLENLVFARGLAEYHHGRIDRFVVFCDRIHHRKVAALSLMILGTKAVVRSVEHAVPARVRLFEPLSHLLEMMVVRSPSLLKYLRAVVIRLKGVSGSPPRSAQPAVWSNGELRRRPPRTSGRAD
jgi:hypothetical protein